MIQPVDFRAAKQLLDETPDILFFDVREEEEYISGHAMGAELFPVGTISRSSAAERVPSYDTPILVYCRTGRRSRRAANTLEALGYQTIYDLGSLAGWPYGITYGE